MSASDGTTVIVGVVTLYFLWQQNQIFKKQNEIFATQVGIKMPPKKSARSRLVRYWPMLAMALLMIATWMAVALDHYSQHGHQTSGTVVVPWALTLILAVMAAYLSRKRVSAAPQADGGQRRYPWNVFTVQKVTADPPTSDPNITYKNKLRIVLTNASGKDIQVWTPLWESTEVHPQGYPLGSRFRLEGPKVGEWVKDENGKNKEYACLDLKINSTVDCYIGLIPPLGQSIERRLQTRTPIGTAIFPVKIDGKLYEVPINL
ncbi:MAG: hypothetical protein WAO35_08820 [Terriglobia bacterium]